MQDVLPMYAKTWALNRIQFPAKGLQQSIPICKRPKLSVASIRDFHTQGSEYINQTHVFKYRQWFLSMRSVDVVIEAAPQILPQTVMQFENHLFLLHIPSA